MKTCLYRCLQPAKSEVCWQGAATRWSPPPSGAQCRREGSQASQNISLSQHVQPGSQSCSALREWHTCQRCKIEFIHAGLAPNCKCLGSVLHRARVAGMVQGLFLPRPAGTRRDEDFEQLSLFEREKNDVGLTPVAHPKMVLEVELIYSGLTVQYFGLLVVSLA